MGHSIQAMPHLYSKHNRGDPQGVEVFFSVSTTTTLYIFFETLSCIIMLKNPGSIFEAGVFMRPCHVKVSGRSYCF